MTYNPIPPTSGCYELEYIIEPIFPRRKVHMIAGPSGSGKTSLLFGLLRDWSAGADVWGCRSYPQPWHFLAVDRDYDEIGYVVRGQGLDPYKLPITCLIPPSTPIKTLIEAHAHAKVLVIDGILMLAPCNINDYKEVGHFLLKCLHLCKEYDVTIIGTPHTAKTKQDNQILHSREKIMGSTGWGGYASTLVFIDQLKDKKTNDPARIVEVLPRVAAPLELLFEFRGASLEPAAPIEEGGRQVSVDTELRLLQCVPLGGTATTAQLMVWGEKLELSRATVTRYVAKWEIDGLLVKQGRGLYLRPQLSRT